MGCGNNASLVKKKLLVRRKYKVLPTLQFYLMRSLQSLSQLQPHWSSSQTWGRPRCLPLQDFHSNYSLTWTLLYSLSLPHLIFWGFVYMSLDPNLNRTHGLFCSSFPQSRAWDKDFCVSAKQKWERALKEGRRVSQHKDALLSWPLPWPSGNLLQCISNLLALYPLVPVENLVERDLFVSSILSEV